MVVSVYDEKENAYAELRGLIRQHFGTIANFAKALGISSASLNEKLQGRVQFKQCEIAKAMELFDLTPDDAARIFFTNKVMKFLRKGTA